MNEPAHGPLHHYRGLVRDHALKPDPAQEFAAEQLQRLHRALDGYHIVAPQRRSWAGRLVFGRGRGQQPGPTGLYLFGGVGRGKSMLMDLFYDNAPVAVKRRVHFHAFMLEVHERLHRWRQARTSAQDLRQGRHTSDPMPPLARALAETAHLLCFDEFHVTDVADAMILSRLFTALMDAGVVVVATSNWPPDELYAGGLQRDRFLPFIALVKQRLEVIELGEGTDFRLARIAGAKVYHYPWGGKSEAALGAMFADLTDDAVPAATSLRLKGRELPVPKAARGVAWFDFETLCGEARGAADYLALAVHYHTLILSGLPRLREELRNEAKRFITLVDALYEHRCKLVLSAEVAPDRLWGGETHGFEFQRTLSRLIEMQSRDYLAAAHLT